MAESVSKGFFTSSRWESGVIAISASLVTRLFTRNYPLCFFTGVVAFVLLERYRTTEIKPKVSCCEFFKNQLITWTEKKKKAEKCAEQAAETLRTLAQKKDWPSLIMPVEKASMMKIAQAQRGWLRPCDLCKGVQEKAIKQLELCLARQEEIADWEKGIKALQEQDRLSNIPGGSPSTPFKPSSTPFKPYKK